MLAPFILAWVTPGLHLIQTPHLFPPPTALPFVGSFLQLRRVKKPGNLPHLTPSFRLAFQLHLLPESAAWI